jgi:hypothetical protein
MDKKKIEKLDELRAEEKILGKLKQNYEYCKQYYGKEHKRMRLLDATDKGELWKACHAKFPPYQLLPDTNFVSYVHYNILASIYTVAKSAQLVPTSEEDVEFCERMNVALEHDWDKNSVGYYQFLAGERASLLNLGVTQVIWDEENHNTAYRNVDPIHYMRDPNAESLDTAGYVMVYQSYDRNWFLSRNKYKKAFKEKVLDTMRSASTENVPDYNGKPAVGDSGKEYNLFIHWVRNPNGGIDEYHTIDNEVLLYSKKNIKPSMFPFAELYCNLPGSSLIGSSEPAKIFANNLVYNLMDSLAYTSVYKNQRPPKFVSTQSGLNIAAFVKHGNEADRTFIVNGDASKAVHYHQFPEIDSTLPALQQSMGFNIKSMSGVDDRYTGRDTGSIITTGGTEEMLNRVTLIDTPKIMNYERYTKRLTELTFRTMAEFSPSRKYAIIDDDRSTPTKTYYKVIEIEQDEMDPDAIFEYAIQISSELPKNKQRVQAWANNMMEKQMQYQSQGLQVDVITPEEWIRCQDVPYKEQILKRMGVQSNLNAYIEAQNVIAEYAAMLDRGDLPEDALAVAADGLQAMRLGEQTPFQQQMDAAQPPMGGGTGMM